MMLAIATNIAIVLMFLVGFLLYLAKLRFVMKILAAKTHVNVFNHSLALCLVTSGDRYVESFLLLIYLIFSFSFLRCWHDDMSSCIGLASR